jgi:hypothetical protein
MRKARPIAFGGMRGAPNRPAVASAGRSRKAADDERFLYPGALVLNTFNRT